MKKTMIMTTLICSMVIAGVSQASPQTRSEGDMLYGGDMGTPSQGQPYEVTGPMQHRSENYLLWNVNAYTPAEGDTVDVRTADDRRMATDMVYGS